MYCYIIVTHTEDQAFPIISDSICGWGNCGWCNTESVSLEHYYTSSNFRNVTEVSSKPPNQYDTPLLTHNSTHRSTFLLGVNWYQIFLIPIGERYHRMIDIQTIYLAKKNYNYITQYPNLVFPLSVLQNNWYSRPHDYAHVNTDPHFSIGGIEYMHSTSLTLSSWLCVHNVAITRSKKRSGIELHS